MIATQALRRRLMVGLASLLVTAHLSGALALGANSPQGDNAAAWPTSWTAYTTSDGSPISDVENDQNPAMVDIASNGGTASSVYAATDGTNVFFRVRLKGDPRDAGKGGFDNANWLVLVATAADDTVRGVVGLYGKGNSTDYVYVSNTPGSAVTQVYATPFDTHGANDSRGARGLEDGNGQYFVDFQVPLARLTAASGNTITASTPVKFFFGSSIANNLATINKDLMAGSVISFAGLATWTLAGGPVSTPDLTPDPSPDPTPDPSDDPSPDPSPDPSDDPSPDPSDDPSPDPSDDPSPDPSDDPSPDPSDDPTPDPSDDPSPDPSDDPTPDPSDDPSPDPSDDPTLEPSDDPSDDASPDPSDDPTPDPSDDPTDDSGFLSVVNQTPSEPGTQVSELDYALVSSALIGSTVVTGLWFFFGRRRRDDDEGQEMPTAPAYN